MASLAQLVIAFMGQHTVDVLIPSCRPAAMTLLRGIFSPRCAACYLVLNIPKPSQFPYGVFYAVSSVT